MADAISSISQSGQLRFDYMNLLVTQLRNQNPLEPMDNYQMSAQLTQLAQLEQLEGIQSKFDKVLAATQLSQSAGMVGRNAAYNDSDGKPVVGKIDAVQYVDGELSYIIGDKIVASSNIIGVSS